MNKYLLIVTALFFGLTSCGGGSSGDGGTPAENISLSTNELTFTANIADSAPVTQTITGSITGINSDIRIDIIIESAKNLFANLPVFVTAGAESGKLTLTPTSPAALGVGVHTAKLTIYICTDLANSCVGNSSQIPGSPKVITITYTVTESTPSIVISNCSEVIGQDNTKNPDGSINVIRSHLNGAPTYKIFTTRNLADNSSVTIDYMVHEPTITTPKGVIILIAGGNLRAKIKGTADNTQPTSSSGNFVVRSAHRYQNAGYRVITIDRPSDTINITNPDNSITPGIYGNSDVAVNIDRYRNSMQHAVDIAAILKRENTEGFNVIISGTSRGAISAAAMNTLVTGIVMSSPVTISLSGAVFAGYPISTGSVILSGIKRTSHVMLHTLDACSVSSPENSRTLFDNLLQLGISVSGNEVSGGIQQTLNGVPVNVCGGLDFHGFNGIETCAVEKETTWANNLMASLATNKTPIANNQTVTLGSTIQLTATDSDTTDTMGFAIPFGITSLGGTVSTDTAGVVTYTSPVGVAGTVDSFAFTVTDGQGGVSTAVVKITIPGFKY